MFYLQWILYGPPMKARYVKIVAGGVGHGGGSALLNFFINSIYHCTPLNFGQLDHFRGSNGDIIGVYIG